MMAALKEIMGIEQANCRTCAYLGNECNDSSDYSYGNSWPVCEKEENWGYNNLKSFPFQKEMSCWVPDFWHSRFADMVKTGSNREMNKLYRMFKQALSGLKVPE
jgi:hypothetical protein